MVLNVHRNRRGRGRLYTYRYTVTTRMTSALRWAAMSHFNVSVGSDGQSHKTVSTNHNLSEKKGEPKRYRTEVLPLTSLAAGPNRLILWPWYSSSTFYMLARLVIIMFLFVVVCFPEDRYKTTLWRYPEVRCWPKRTLFISLNGLTFFCQPTPQCGPRLMS